jgi:choline kinase
MKIDNSSYTVTPPDLYMTEHGISILISSTNENFIASVKEVFEKFIATSIVFLVQSNKTNSGTLPWIWNVSKTSDFMIIDVDTCAWEDIMAGLLKSKDEENTVLFYSDKYKRRETVKLINATGTNLVVRSINDINNYIKLQMSPEYFNEV